MLGAEALGCARIVHVITLGTGSVCLKVGFPSLGSQMKMDCATADANGQWQGGQPSCLDSRTLGKPVPVMLIPGYKCSISDK